MSWRQIVDNIPGLVATMAERGEVEFLNRQTLEYFGKTNEELKDWSSSVPFILTTSLESSTPARNRSKRDRSIRSSTAAAAPTACTDGSRFAESPCGMRKMRQPPGICC